ncbi:MAG: AMP-binding protein, partial [Rhodospirillales bacterium]|nr:AMP-binding protein [Rhodospirillales bacterium]
MTRYSGRSILIRVRGQLAAVSAILALDGVARRLLLCPPDVPEEQIPRLMQLGEVDIMLAEADFEVGPQAVERSSVDLSRYDTEWVLFTSGTSGFPKLVQHSLASLIAPLDDGLPAKNAVWGTFYDIRRYGGLQILLRALIGGGSMVLSEATEPVAAFLSRLDEAWTTHISGTPSHWRRVLMSGAAEKITPAYVRLSGEMAGQDILDRLHAAYPQAAIGHAYASTEAGVAFSVNDGQEGFPATVLCAGAPRPEIKVKSQTLWVRSSAAATRYLGHASRQLADEEGFVDTGDVVEQCGDRYMFAGRREGVVNVGGMKVHPEEVEATINRHPAVAMSRVWGRPSPI